MYHPDNMNSSSQYDEQHDPRLDSLSTRISNLKMQCQGFLQEDPGLHLSPSVASDVTISVSPASNLSLPQPNLPLQSSPIPFDYRADLSPTPFGPTGRVSPYMRTVDPVPGMPGSSLSLTPSTQSNLSHSRPSSVCTTPLHSLPFHTSDHTSNKASAEYLQANSMMTTNLPVISTHLSGHTNSSYISQPHMYSKVEQSPSNGISYTPNTYESLQLSSCDRQGLFQANSLLPSASGYQRHNSHFQAGLDETNGIATNSSNLFKPIASSLQSVKSSENLLEPPIVNLGGCISPHYSYFKETVEDLGPEEYRWFYKTGSDKKWIPFIGYDSLRIEWKFRDMQINGDINQDCASENGSTSGNESEEKPFELGKMGTVTVRGGMYEVDVQQRKGQSIYWRGEVFCVCRGTWFYEGAWTPLDEHLAAKVESEHLTHFRGHPLDVSLSVDPQKQAVHRLAVPGGAVEWFSASEIYLSLDATPSRLMRSVGKKLGFQKTGYKIHRGYSEDASASDKPPDITHLVFVIHGIGQKMDTGRIIKNSTSLRENVNTLKQKHMKEVSPELHGSENDSTVEFFPVEWRSSLTLDNGLIDCITPHKILNIRQMLNASFMDIMYYNSPQYREEIVTGLSSELNRLYAMFTERNPYFEANGGQVSVVSHSLGCVITYDIITGWSPTPQLSTSFLQAMSDVLGTQRSLDGSSHQLQTALHELLRQQHSQAEQPNLNFTISNMFCLGSPLAVFLALRWKKTKGSLPMTSKGRFQRILNIFHPADPVAYRLEPLLSSAYTTIAPVTIHCHSASDKLPYTKMPFEPIVLGKDASAPPTNSDTVDQSCLTPTSQPTTPVKAGGGNSSSSTWNLWGLMKGGKKPEVPSVNQGSSYDPNSSSPSGGCFSNSTEVLLDCGRLSESERIDFVLREGSMESSYISALTSHTSYWTNLDVAHFLLTILYPNLPTCTATAAVTPATPVVASASSATIATTSGNGVSKL